jgi:hypothetical protein
MTADKGKIIALPASKRSRISAEFGLYEDEATEREVAKIKYTQNKRTVPEELQELAEPHMRAAIGKENIVEQNRPTQQRSCNEIERYGIGFRPDTLDRAEVR